MVHSSAWRCTYMPPGHVFHGRGLVNLNVTSTPTPPLADPMTLPQAAEGRRPAAAVRSSRGCAAVPLTAETLLPSYQTTPRTPRTLPVRPAPPLTLAAHISHTQAVVVEDGGGWTSSTARGHLQSSWGRGPSRGPCWRAGRGRFRTAQRTFIHTAARFCVLGSRGGGSGVDVRAGPTHS